MGSPAAVGAEEVRTFLRHLVGTQRAVDLRRLCRGDALPLRCAPRSPCRGRAHPAAARA